MADPVTMALAIAPAVLSAGTTLMAGNQADAIGKAQQQQASIRAKEEIAAGQREAREEERKKELAQSTLMTRAGASGSGVSDPTIAKLNEGIEAEGTYNARAAMATAQNQARSTRYQGALQRWQGKQEKKASYFDAAGTLIGSFLKTSPMQKKFGGGSIGSTGYG